jgi:hypothetical protein
VHDESDNIDGGEHPDPFGLVFVPHKQLFNVLVYENVDSIGKRH